MCSEGASVFARVQGEDPGEEDLQEGECLLEVFLEGIPHPLPPFH
jgi:hypothetical protein